MTQEGWDTPRTDDGLAYEEAWERARAQETEAEDEERERAQTLIDNAEFDAGYEPCSLTVTADLDGRSMMSQTLVGPADPRASRADAQPLERSRIVQHTATDLTEQDVDLIVLALDALGWNEGRGAFGGSAPWKPERIAEIVDLRNRLTGWRPIKYTDAP